MKTLFLILTITASMTEIAMADDVWAGSGTTYDHNRVEIGSYHVTVDNEQTAENEQTSTVTVELPSGETFEQVCVSESDDEKWRKTCDDGRVGGGYYFDTGIATEYTEKDGRGYAVSIIFDSETTMRFLVTIMENGDVVRFDTMVLSKMFPQANTIESAQGNL